MGLLAVGAFGFQPVRIHQCAATVFSSLVIAFPTALQMKNTLRELRAAKAWSQADLAEKLGVSRQTVNAIETGKYDPSLPLACKVVRLFKKSIEEIFELDEK